MTVVRVRFGEFVFDSATRQLSRGGEPVPLAPKAFDLLQALIEERPRAMRKEELRERLWPDVVVDEANLKNLIGEIRAALADKKVIRTVHRYGYAFVADDYDIFAVPLSVSGSRVRADKPCLLLSLPRFGVYDVVPDGFVITRPAAAERAR